MRGHLLVEVGGRSGMERGAFQRLISVALSVSRLNVDSVSLVLPRKNPRESVITCS